MKAFFEKRTIRSRTKSFILSKTNTFKILLKSLSIELQFEIWKKVFDNINDISTYMNLFGNHPELDTLLQHSLQARKIYFEITSHYYGDGDDVNSYLYALAFDDYEPPDTQIRDHRQNYLDLYYKVPRVNFKKFQKVVDLIIQKGVKLDTLKVSCWIRRLHLRVSENIIKLRGVLNRLFELFQNLELLYTDLTGVFCDIWSVVNDSFKDKVTSLNISIMSLDFVSIFPNETFASNNLKHVSFRSTNVHPDLESLISSLRPLHGLESLSLYIDFASDSLLIYSTDLSHLSELFDSFTKTKIEVSLQGISSLYLINNSSELKRLTEVLKKVQLNLDCSTLHLERFPQLQILVLRNNTIHEKFKLQHSSLHTLRIQFSSESPLQFDISGLKNLKVLTFGNTSNSQEKFCIDNSSNCSFSTIPDTVETIQLASCFVYGDVSKLPLHLLNLIVNDNTVVKFKINTTPSNKVSLILDIHDVKQSKVIGTNLSQLTSSIWQRLPVQANVSSLRQYVYFNLYYYGDPSTERSQIKQELRVEYMEPRKFLCSRKTFSIKITTQRKYCDKIMRYMYGVCMIPFQNPTSYDCRPGSIQYIHYDFDFAKELTRILKKINTIENFSVELADVHVEK